jgi:tetratricopeptide (TPR) repeat protein
MEEQEQNRIDVDELMEQGKFDDAIKVLKKCVSVLPKDDERLGGVYFMIGKTYRAKEDYVKAEEYFQRSVDHGEEVGIVDPIPLRELVSTLAWQGKTGKAWKYYAQLQIHDSDPVHTRAMLIPIMVKNGEYQGAIDSYESLVPKHQYFQLLPHVAEAQEGLLNYTAASHSLQEYLDKMDQTIHMYPWHCVDLLWSS